MLNWICPECGREVPATDPACSACEQSPIAQQQELFPAPELPFQSRALEEANEPPSPAPAVESLSSAPPPDAEPIDATPPNTIEEPPSAPPAVESLSIEPPSDAEPINATPPNMIEEPPSAPAAESLSSAPPSDAEPSEPPPPISIDELPSAPPAVEELQSVELSESSPSASAPDEPPQAVEPVLEIVESLQAEPAAPLLAAGAPQLDLVHYGALNSAMTMLVESVLEAIPSEPVLRIVESFHAAPSSPLLFAGEPFREPSPTLQPVLARPNIGVRAPAGKPAPSKPEAEGFAQRTPLLPSELSGVRPERPTAAPLPAPVAVQIQRRSRIPGWIITPVLVVLVFVAAHLLMQTSGASGEAKPVATPAPVVQPVAPGTAAATSPDGWPFAHFIEVTGIRVVVDANHHSQLHFLVVNHSAGDLSDVSLRIGVRSASDPSKTLFRLAAAVPFLGPFASKEIKVDLATQMRASDIPEWELLRADVQAGPL